MTAADLFQFALAIVICTVGLASLAGHLLRPRPRDSLLLWTGLFALVYGVRMFTHQPLASTLGAPARPAAYVENALNMWIVIPALFFTQELYGRGWKGSLRILLGLATLYASAGVLIDVIARNPGAVPDPAGVLLAPGVIVVFGAGALAGYRPPAPRGGTRVLRYRQDIRVLLAGVVVFVAFVVHEHLAASGLLRTPRGLEPIGFLVSLACLGYIALTRFFHNARQLAATEQEMQSAREIQTSILPRTLPVVRGVDVAARYVPLAAVAGDFYDVVDLGDGAVAVLVADVSGHGVPAALVASMVKVAFAGESARTSDPASILEGMNTALCGLFDRTYVTAACATIDAGAREVRYALAGHPPPVLVADGAVRTLDERGLFLGMFPSASYTTAKVPLDDAARVVFYTDGITEAAASGSDDLFGLERLVAFSRESRASTAAEFADTLLRELAAFTRTQGFAHDDVTLVVVDVGRPERPAPPRN